MTKNKGGAFFSIVPITEEAKNNQMKLLAAKEKPFADRLGRYVDMKLLSNSLKIFIFFGIVLTVVAITALIIGTGFIGPVWTCAIISGVLVVFAYGLDKVYDIDKNIRDMKRNLLPYDVYKKNLNAIEIAKENEVKQKLGDISDDDYKKLVGRQFKINQKIAFISRNDQLGSEKEYNGAPRYEVSHAWLAEYYVKALEKSLKLDDLKSDDVITKAKNILEKRKEELENEFRTEWTKWANTDRFKKIDIEEFKKKMMKKLDKPNAVVEGSTYYQDIENVRRMEGVGDEVRFR